MYFALFVCLIWICTFFLNLQFIHLIFFFFENSSFYCFFLCSLDEFMAGFGVISLKLKEMYQMLTLGGDAELELV